MEDWEDSLMVKEEQAQEPVAKRVYKNHLKELWQEMKQQQQVIQSLWEQYVLVSVNGQSTTSETKIQIDSNNNLGDNSDESSRE
jgi:hypothetical protein